jgi:hypothetical protein
LGRGYAAFHAGANFAFWAFSEVRQEKDVKNTAIE